MPERRPARRSRQYVTDGVDPLDWQLEALIATDFKLQVRQRRQRIVENDAQPGEVAGQPRSGVPKQLKWAECLEGTQSEGL